VDVARVARGPERVDRSSVRPAASAAVVMEDDMSTLNWNAIIQALVLIRIGQELGTDSRLARALNEVVHALMFAWR
jgi:hypothetical protein